MIPIVVALLLLVLFRRTACSAARAAVDAFAAAALLEEHLRVALHCLTGWLRRPGPRNDPSHFQQEVTDYLMQIQGAQLRTRLEDREHLGIVASTIDCGDTLPPYQQCLKTPFQCIGERVGLAASLWGPSRRAASILWNGRYERRRSRLSAPIQLALRPSFVLRWLNVRCAPEGIEPGP